MFNIISSFARPDDESGIQRKPTAIRRGFKKSNDKNRPSKRVSFVFKEKSWGSLRIKIKKSKPQNKTWIYLFKIKHLISINH